MKKFLFAVLVAFSFCLINSGDALAKRTVEEVQGKGLLGDFDGEAIRNKKGVLKKVKGTITTEEGYEVDYKQNGRKITIKPKK